ncbi:hypothetical protein AciX8_4411 [Granulicella mallensis MP5ACTX8]|uniref:Uncharacterized protein n=1 Tax=Granulicella mallensis (strain ATCC BAA-1857 / DSM 23137 / MP5ACTX8) TaxID=682795 RepID=G8NU49_GRAMM|nr:hypothetical protein AciX8_4411 [Granulicella mallensis MP5ACTX8]
MLATREFAPGPCGGKGLNCIGKKGCFGVLRLRHSQSTRVTSLRMTILGEGKDKSNKPCFSSYNICRTYSYRTTPESHKPPPASN